MIAVALRACSVSLFILASRSGRERDNNQCITICLRNKFKNRLGNYTDIVMCCAIDRFFVARARNNANENDNIRSKKKKKSSRLTKLHVQTCAAPVNLGEKKNHCFYISPRRILRVQKRRKKKKRYLPTLVIIDYESIEIARVRSAIMLLKRD